MTENEAQRQIVADLRACGITRGGMLLVHSSLRSLGTVPGGCETVIAGLLEAVGPAGTLLLPALSYKHVNTSNATFDARSTPSNVGAIPEYFRRRPGTARSVHPTHSICATGRRALELLADHHLDTTPVGPNSPLSKLPNCGGQILMLGCGLGPNTSMHGVEELVEPPYLFGKTTSFRLVHADGRETTMHCRRHDFDGWIQRYDRLGPLLEDSGMKTGKVLQASVHLIDAAAMWQRAMQTMQRDPLYFVDPQ